MADQFQFDVFLSHSAEDKAVVRDVAARLQRDGVRVWLDEEQIKPGDSIPAKIEEGLEHSRVLVLCMSANAFGSDWAQLESYTFRFRDPLNKERRFIPLRLDDAPIKGSLAQFLYINWLPADRDKDYSKLLEACRQLAKSKEEQIKEIAKNSIERIVHLKTPEINTCVFSPDGKWALTGGPDHAVRMWDMELGNCLRVFKGHTSGKKRYRQGPWNIIWSADQKYAASSSSDTTVRLWDIEKGECSMVLRGHTEPIWALAWSPNNKHIISGSNDGTFRVWDVETGKCLRVLKDCNSDVVMDVAWHPNGLHVISCNGHQSNLLNLQNVNSGNSLRFFKGHTQTPWTVILSRSGDHILSAGNDQTLRLWDTGSGRCLRVLEGHTHQIFKLAWGVHSNLALSGSADSTVRLWDLNKGHCLGVFGDHEGQVVGLAWSSNGKQAFSCDAKGTVRVWNLSEFEVEAQPLIISNLPDSSEQIQYTNAKVLLVGDTNAGKTGLTHRLAAGDWKPSEDSTVGAWSTQWQLKDGQAAVAGIEREIWLWDFGGQADQRLIHQLYMDRTALILLLFNSDKEDVLPGLRDWQTALRRCIKEKIPHFLVAGRVDTGFKASRGKLQAFAKEQGLTYHETSAKTGEGCNELRTAMLASIPWGQMEMRTSPRIFKLIKDEILKLRDEGQVLHTFKELRELLWQRLPNEPRFSDDTLKTVIGLLDGPGIVKELEYGTYILLAPEWINAYAQAVIRTLRSAANDLGVLPLQSIAEGKLIYQSIGRDGVPVEMKRLPAAEERVVLGEMERQLLQRSLCLRQGNKLVFPSHCGRDKDEVHEHPSVFVSYSVKGYLDDVYATLVVKLADSGAFNLKELWRDAADFVTLTGDHHMGVKLARESASNGEISIFFGKGVTQQEQVVFANYIHAHLTESGEMVQRLRQYVCPKCHTPKGNPQVLMEKLLAKKQKADTECDKCGERFPLWDALEKKYASESVCKQVEELQAEDSVQLDSRRKGKLLALEVGARITSADQKCFEIPATEDEGLDMELEFTDSYGEGTGRRLYLQLKSGNSYLTKRKKDGAEIFTIKKQRWVKYWLQQPHPVMLVIGTFSEEDERMGGKDKLQFAEVRWMEISSELKRLSEDGKKPVKQIEFKGERLDMSSVMGWREKILSL